MMNQDKFIDLIEQIIEKHLEKKGLNTQEWHLGKVYNVNDSNTLDVYIDGSTNITPNVPCNPQYDFKVGDAVWVQYINGQQSNKFIPSRRAIGEKRSSGSNVVDTDKNYVHNQISSSNTWSIPHNMGKFPGVSVTDSAGNLVIGDVSYVDENNLIITFSSAFSGKAYLN